MQKPKLTGLGVQIRIYRLKHGLNQTEFGKLTGMNVASVSLIERGLRRPHMGTLQRILKVIGAVDIPVSVLLGDATGDVHVEAVK